VRSNYRTNDRAWALFNREMSDAHFLFRIRPQNEDTFDFDTKAAKYSCRQRINTYHASARGWVASNPA
jgi:nucleoid-associated protein YejK